jgi:1,4-dihydroxy-2-naphthoate octaprenyltransferase
MAAVVVGAAVAFAEGGFRPGPALAALFGALMLQVGANLTNDVLDFERGADTAERLGPVRATQAGLLTPAAVKFAAAGAFLLAAVAGAYLTAVAGWPVIVVGGASILAAIAYTGGPFPLAHHGLGEPFVMVFFGFVAVCGTVFVQLGRVTPLAWIAAAPPGALATAVLVVNNVRDAPTDRAAGRRTLPVTWGRRAGVVEFALLVAMAFAIPVGMVLWGRMSLWLLLPVILVPWAWRLVRTLATIEGQPLNRTLARTAQLLLLHSALFAAGIVLAGPAPR